MPGTGRLKIHMTSSCQGSLHVKDYSPSNRLLQYKVINVVKKKKVISSVTKEITKWSPQEWCWVQTESWRRLGKWKAFQDKLGHDQWIGVSQVKNTETNKNNPGGVLEKTCSLNLDKFQVWACWRSPRCSDMVNTLIKPPLVYPPPLLCWVGAQPCT